MKRYKHNPLDPTDIYESEKGEYVYADDALAAIEQRDRRIAALEADLAAVEQARKEEREACAKVADGFALSAQEEQCDGRGWSGMIAAAIRARGEKP